MSVPDLNYGLRIQGNKVSYVFSSCKQMFWTGLALMKLLLQVHFIVKYNLLLVMLVFRYITTLVGMLKSSYRMI